MVAVSEKSEDSTLEAQVKEVFFHDHLISFY